MPGRGAWLRSRRRRLHQASCRLRRQETARLRDGACRQPRRPSRDQSSLNIHAAFFVTRSTHRFEQMRRFRRRKPERSEHVHDIRGRDIFWIVGVPNLVVADFQIERAAGLPFVGEPDLERLYQAFVRNATRMRQASGRDRAWESVLSRSKPFVQNTFEMRRCRRNGPRRDPASRGTLPRRTAV